MVHSSGSLASRDIAGYRLIRSLARGRHSDIWLAAPSDHTRRTGPTDAAADPVAIKLYHPPTPVSRIDVEVEALGRASHRHLQQLIDLATDPFGRACVVLSRLGPSVARVLENRGELSAGEAVTILAPLSLAVAELHRVGVAHGRIDGGSVLLDPVGAPVLTRFGDATLVGEFPHPPSPSSLTPAAAEAEPALVRDRTQLAEFAELVLQRTPAGSSVLAWLRQKPAGSVDFALELADRLFSSSTAAPVTIRLVPEHRVDDPASDFRRGVHAALDDDRADDNAPTTDPETIESPAGLIMSMKTAIQLPPWLDSWLDSTIAQWSRRLPIDSLRERVRESLRPVRKSVWIAAACGAAAFVAAAVVLSGDSSTPQSPPADQAAHTRELGSTTKTDTAPVVVDPAALAAIVGDDALGAAQALVTLRDSCIRERSVLCLDGVDQPDSAAMENDRHYIRQLQQGANANAPLEWGSAELVLIDRLGDGALFDVQVHADPQRNPDASGNHPTLTASLLLVRTEAGWRIRDLTQW